MNRCQAQAKDLFCFEQVPDIGHGIVLAGVTVAALFDRAWVLGILGLAQVDPPVAGEQAGVACKARRQHTVKHVDPAADSLEQVLGGAHSHEVARPVLGQQGNHVVEHGMHLFFGLSDAQPADGIPRQVEPGQKACALPAQLGVDPTLDNAKQGLVSAGLRFPAAFRPAMRALHGLFAVCPIVRSGTLVKGHDDVRPQFLLDGNDTLGRKAVLRPVEVGAKGHPIVVDFAQPLEAEHLESAAVGEDRMRPVHESVQVAEAGDHVGARAQVQVVRVAEDEARTCLLQFLGADGLDRSLCAHRSKDRQ